ncbi:MAG: protein kinase, partial [Planctomycetales bacterium]|nr:protein kinase [Planctomycetales bacterium]
DRETLHDRTVNSSDAAAHMASELEGFEFLRADAREGDLGQVGEYRLLKLLGRGGMGVVFLAEDTVLRRQVALKLLQPGAARNDAVRDRFMREAQAAAALDHDNIVHVYQVGLAHDAPYLAMQLLKGETLTSYLRRKGQLEQADAARIGSEIARGLAAAHAQGLIHRDIKPDNLWIEPTGRVKILDFGLARDLQSSENMTMEGALLGTPRYMSPEQAIGNPLDGRSDLFSLGSVLYELLTGKAAFEGSNLVSILMAISKHDPEAWGSLDGNIDTELKELLSQLLAKTPAKRPAAASTVAEQLASIAARLERNSREKLAPVSAAPRVASGMDRGSRRRWFYAAAAGAAAIFLGIVIYVKLKDGRELKINVSDDVQELHIDVEGEGQAAVEPNVPPRATLASDYDPTPVGVPGTWAVGPDPLWNTGGVFIDSCEVLPGIVERPRSQESGRRWNYETVWPRSQSHVAKVSPDGTYLAIGSQDGATRVYSVDGFKLLTILPGFGGTNGVDGIAWSSDSQALALVADGAKHLRIWTVSGHLTHDEFIDGVTSVAWHPSMPLIAVGTYSQIRLLHQDQDRLEPVEPAVSLPTGARFRCLEWSPDGSRLAAMNFESKVFVWDLHDDSAASPSLTERFTKDLGNASSIAWSPSGDLAVVGDSLVEVFDADGESLKSFPYTGSVVCWTPDGRSMFGHDSGVARLFSMTAEDVESNPMPLWAWADPTAITALRDGRWLIASGNVVVVSSDLKETLFESPTRSESSRDIEWSSDGEHLWIATQPVPERTRIIKTDRWGVWRSAITAAKPTMIEFMAMGIRDDQQLFTSREQLWTSRGESLVPFFPMSALSIRWSPDGKYCAVGTTSGNVLILNEQKALISEQQVGEGETLVNWDPTTNRLAIACGAKLYWTSEAEDWEPRMIVDAGEWLAFHPVWGPKGEWIDVFGVGRWSVSGERLETNVGRLAMNWQPNGEPRAVSTYAHETWVLTPGGLPLASRTLNTQARHMRVPAWNPRHGVVAIPGDYSVVNLLSATDLEPLASILLLYDGEALSFSAAGELLDASNKEAMRHIVKVEIEDGQISLDSPIDAPQ